VFSNQAPQAIIDANLDFIEKTGLSQHLAQTRSNGLLAMVKQIKFYAMAYSVQNKI
jgi:cysteine desulfuration protein SufE